MEKLAQLNPHTGLGPLSKSKSKPFEPKVLLKSFDQSIRILRELAERNQHRVEKLEHVCDKQEKEHGARIRELEATYQVCVCVWCGVCVRVCVRVCVCVA